MIDMTTLRSRNLQTILWISLAILGANLRYWLGAWIAQRWGTQYPYATLLIMDAACSWVSSSP